MVAARAPNDAERHGDKASMRRLSASSLAEEVASVARRRTMPSAADDGLPSPRSADRVVEFSGGQTAIAAPGCETRHVARGRSQEAAACNATANAERAASTEAVDPVITAAHTGGGTGPPTIAAPREYDDNQAGLVGPAHREAAALPSGDDSTDGPLPVRVAADLVEPHGSVASGPSSAVLAMVSKQPGRGAGVTTNAERAESPRPIPASDDPKRYWRTTKRKPKKAKPAAAGGEPSSLVSPITAAAGSDRGEAARGTTTAKVDAIIVVVEDEASTAFGEKATPSPAPQQQSTQSAVTPAAEVAVAVAVEDELPANGPTTEQQKQLTPLAPRESPRSQSRRSRRESAASSAAGSEPKPETAQPSGDAGWQPVVRLSQAEVASDVSEWPAIVQWAMVVPLQLLVWAATAWAAGGGLALVAPLRLLQCHYVAPTLLRAVRTLVQWPLIVLSMIFAPPIYLGEISNGVVFADTTQQQASGGPADDSGKRRPKDLNELVIALKGTKVRAPPAVLGGSWAEAGGENEQEAAPSADPSLPELAARCRAGRCGTSMTELHGQKWPQLGSAQSWCHRISSAAASSIAASSGRTPKRTTRRRGRGSRSRSRTLWHSTCCCRTWLSFAQPRVCSWA